jgi:hypothetical protein
MGMGLKLYGNDHPEAVELNVRLHYVAGKYSVGFANSIRHNTSQINAVYYSIVDRKVKRFRDMHSRRLSYLYNNRKDDCGWDSDLGLRVNEFGVHEVLTDAGRWEEMYD